MTSDQWGSHPLIYEVNTWPWLAYLSKKYSRPITLLNIPEEVFTNDFAHFDAVWLMGVWTRSPSGINIAKNHTGLLAEYKEALSDFSLEDVVGSPYSIHQYEVDPHLGGQEELETFSAVLHRHGIKLILDFVPNHVAVDHEWGINHPEYFLHGSKGDLERDSHTFFTSGDAIYAHGKDPYFSAWTDTLQVNPFSPEYRAQTISTLLKMAEYSDGVRCDMAMLLVSSVFWQTWGERTAAHPEEYWGEIIRTVKQDHPQFLFIAEVYWGMEWDLQQMGFDLCYDKRLYDRLLHDSVDRIKGHLHAEWKYQRKLLRFVENHDEPRALTSFGSARSLAAASLTMLLPGASLTHFGQQIGKKIKLPVQLGRFPSEDPDSEIASFYRSLLQFLGPEWRNLMNTGEWMLLDTTSPFISYLWRSSERILIGIWNYSDYVESGTVHFPQDIPLFTEENPDTQVSIFSEPFEVIHISEKKNSSMEIRLRSWQIHLIQISPNESTF
jgi:hypothetical protein